MSNSHVAVVSDFGLSLAIENIRTRSALSRDKPRGTTRWMAPECLEGSRVTKASDVWSLDMTVWEVRLMLSRSQQIINRTLYRYLADRSLSLRPWSGTLLVL